MKKQKSGKKEYFYFGEKMIDSFIVPGVKTTNVRGMSCTDMVPQGITYYDGYYFITAYCYEEEHNSVIYVMDGTTKGYITTLVLGDKTNGEAPHVGGIIYANNFLWIGASDKVHYYDYSEIKNAVLYAESHTNIKSIYLKNYTWGEMSISSGGFASFVSTYNGYLCLGKWSEESDVNGIIGYYYPKVTESGSLGCIGVGEIPPRAQGIDFYVAGNNTYIILTVSWGYIPSRIYVYKKSGKTMSGTWELKKEILFPCKVEQVEINGSNTYFIFESCAKTYRFFSNPVIGAVCGFSTNFILK